MVGTDIRLMTERLEGFEQNIRKKELTSCTTSCNIKENDCYMSESVTLYAVIFCKFWRKNDSMLIYIDLDLYKTRN